MRQQSARHQGSRWGRGSRSDGLGFLVVPCDGIGAVGASRITGHDPGVLLVGVPRKRKLLLEANHRPPSLVDVRRGVTAGQGGVAVIAGRRAPQCPAPQLLHTLQLLHPARALGVAGA